MVRVRSSGGTVPARLRPMEKGAEVAFSEGQDGVAPGQACVFYDSVEPSRVLGGGFIAEALRQDAEPAGDTRVMAAQ